MRLSDISVGDSVVVESLDFAPVVTKRFRDLGFCEGDRVESVRAAAMLSPVLYYTKGAYIAVRKSDASRIGVAYEQ